MDSKQLEQLASDSKWETYKQVASNGDLQLEHAYKAGFKKALELVWELVQDNSFTMPAHDFKAVAIWNIKSDFEDIIDLEYKREDG